MSRRRVWVAFGLFVVAAAGLVAYATRDRWRPSPAPQALSDEEVIQAWREAGFEYGWCGKDIDGRWYSFRDTPTGLAGALPAFSYRRVFQGPIPRLPDLSKPYSLVQGGVGGSSWVPVKDLQGLKNLRLLAHTPSHFRFPLSTKTLKELREVGLLHALWLAEGPGGVRPTGPEDVESFTLVDRSSVSSEGLAQLAVFPNLKVLRLYYLPRMDDPAISSFRNLTALDVLGGEVPEAGLKVLQTLPNFASLEVGTLAATEGGFKELKGLKHLTRLRVWNGVTDSGLKHLAEMPSLSSLDIGRVSGAGLRDLAKLKNLRELDVHLSGGEGLEASLNELQGLESVSALDLTVSQPTAANLKAVARLRNLRRLSLGGGSVTDGVLAALRGLSNLGELQVSSSAVTDAGLKHLAGLKVLTSLDLTGTKVTGAGLDSLTGLTRLHTLTLPSHSDSSMRALRKAGILHAIAEAKAPGGARPKSPGDVVALELRYGPGGVTDEGLRELKALPNLVWLRLGGANISPGPMTDGALRALREIGLLHAYSGAMTAGRGRPASAREVSVFEMSGDITAAGIKELKDLTKLNDLRLTNVDDGVLRALRETGLLHALNRSMDGPPRPTGPEEVRSFNLAGTKVTDKGVSELTVFKNLETLDLNHTKVSARGVGQLAGLTRLEEVRLDPAAVTDRTLKDLVALSSLTRLDLTGGGVTDQGLPLLAKFPNLGTLSLSHPGVTDEGLARLLAVKRLTVLGLDGTGVTDAGLEVLKELKSLTSLGLSLTEVTDAGVKDLSEMTTLTFLDLSHTRVTLPGLMALRKALPRCVIRARHFPEGW